ncbi:MAG: hypothetical protein ACRDO2_12135 [Nocardioidaceae bacterium]
MNIDELLRKAADDVASRAELTPPPDVAEVRRRALSHRRRQVTGFGIAVAALVLGIAMAGTRTAGDPDSGPAHRPRAEDLSGTVWADFRGLHVAGTLVVESGEPTAEGRAQIAGISLVQDGVVYSRWSRWEGPCEPQSVFVRDVAGDNQQLTSRALTPPTGDPLGSHVAWFDGNRNLVVMDAATGATVAHARDALPVFGPFCNNPIRSVSGSTVTFESAGVVYTFDWTVGSEPIRDDLQRGSLIDRAGHIDAIAEESGLTDDAGLPLVRIRFVADGGTLATSEPMASSPMYGYGMFSADGRYLAVKDNSFNGRIVVMDAQTGAPQDLDLADDYFAAGVGWGVGDTLMVGFRKAREDGVGPGPMPSRLAVCDISEGSCGFVSKDVGSPRAGQRCRTVSPKIAIGGASIGLAGRPSHGITLHQQG